MADKPTTPESAQPVPAIPEAPPSPAPSLQWVEVRCTHDGFAPGIAGGVELFKSPRLYPPDVAAQIVAAGHGELTKSTKA